MSGSRGENSRMGKMTDPLVGGKTGARRNKELESSAKRLNEPFLVLSPTSGWEESGTNAARCYFIRGQNNVAVDLFHGNDERCPIIGKEMVPIWLNNRINR